MKSVWSNWNTKKGADWGNKDQWAQWGDVDKATITKLQKVAAMKPMAPKEDKKDEGKTNVKPIVVPVPIFLDTNKPTEEKVNAETVAQDKPLITEEPVISWSVQTHPKGEGPSYLVQKIVYDPNTKILLVTYTDNFTAKYDDIPKSDVSTFIASPSKGRWALQNLWKKPYKQA